MFCFRFSLCACHVFACLIHVSEGFRTDAGDVNENGQSLRHSLSTTRTHQGGATSNLPLWEAFWRFLIGTWQQIRWASGSVPFSPVRNEFQAHSLQSRPKSRVYFLFTTIPPHASRVQAILELMREQTLVPDGVILTIPKSYKRFKEKFPLEKLPKDSLLKVNWIDTDAGVGAFSKYSGHSMADDQDIVVIGDDDEKYSNTFIEDFVGAVEESPKDAIFTGEVDNDFNGVMGYSGVACRAGSLRRLPSSIPQRCLLADDVVMTGFADHAGLAKYHLQKRNVDTNSDFSWNATSIHSFHDGNVVEGLNVNHQCLQDLKDNPIW